ncbi:hypothetical protein QYF36_005870 [Acer negundo]|nr:hypothetical protein QYF36_005870 [Acer negundo]
MAWPLIMCRVVPGVRGTEVGMLGRNAMLNGRHDRSARLVDIAMESPFMEDIMRGKVSLITGDGSRIGFEISTQFSQHGDSIAIMGHGKQVLNSVVFAL